MKFREFINATVIRKTLTAILILVCIVIFLFAFKKDAEHAEPVGSYGKPTVFVQKNPLKKFSIDQLADDSQCLYLLDELNGVVLVFDIHGTYKHTVSFYKTLNGAFRIATNQDILYVEDSKNNLYILRFGAFEQFIKASDRTTNVEVNFQQTSSNYALRWDGIYKITVDEETCIIRRPIQSIAYNKSWRFLLIFCCFSIMAIYRIARKQTGYT